jgi:predicted metal-dependent peptidase
MDITKLNREMGKTKVALMANSKLVFFSTLVMSLKTVWDEHHKTAYTNGRVIGWNPDWYLSLSKDERVFVAAHEAMHAISHHCIRGVGKNQKAFNAACDYWINLMLVDYGLKMPACGGLYDQRFRNMTVFEIYDVLMKEGYVPPSDLWDDLRAPETDTATHQHEIQEILVRAATVAKMSSHGAGSIPAGIQIILQEMLDPKLPWTTILSRWLHHRIKTGYNYQRPNKRYFPDVFLPSRSSKGLKKLTVFMDVSCSVEDYQFTHMVSELTGVLKRFKPEITLITFNTHITGKHVIKSLEELRRVVFTGRGGTDPECVFDWIEENKPDASIIFTDGDFTFKRDKLSSEVVWIINDNDSFTAPFGKVVHYETK